MELIKSEQQLYIDNEFLDDFISLPTRVTYKQILKDFFEFINDNYSRVSKFSEIDRKMVIKYKNFINETGGYNGEQMAPNSIRKHLSAVSSYFDFLVMKKILSTNPAGTIKRPKCEVLKPTKALNLDQVEELFNSIHSKEAGPLHMALISTLWLTGMRKSEVLNLRRKDYYKENGDVILQYKGKGGKYRRKLVHSRLEKILDDYLLWMKENNREHEQEDWLFRPTKNPHSPKDVDKSINPRTLNRIIDKYSKKMGLDFKISPHSARATFISLLLDEEVPIADVAREVAHSSINTTQEYDRRRKTIKESLVKKLPF